MTARLSHLIGHVLIILAAVTLLLMMVHVTADVIGKYLFDAPIPGTTEVVTSYYISAVFLPLAWVGITGDPIAGA